MSKIKGTISGCGKGKFSYFITLEEKEGYYFNTKFEPKCGKGDVVGIEYESKADNRGNVQRIEVLEKNSSGYEDTSKKADSGYASNSGSSKSAGGGDRQDSIVWQSSRKDALVAAGLILQVEAYALKGKTDEKRVQLDGLIDEITARYFADASDPRKSVAYTTNAEIEADAATDEDAPPEAGGEKSDEWGDEWD